MNLPIADSLGTWISADSYGCENLGIQGYHPCLHEERTLHFKVSAVVQHEGKDDASAEPTEPMDWFEGHFMGKRRAWVKKPPNMGGSCTFSPQLIRGNAGDSHWIGKSVEQSDLFPRFLLWYLCHCTLGNMPATAIAKSCFLGRMGLGWPIMN